MIPTPPARSGRLRGIAAVVSPDAARTLWRCARAPGAPRSSDYHARRRLMAPGALRGHPRQVTSMRVLSPSRHLPTDQSTAGSKRGNRTRDTEDHDLLLYPSELACGGYRPVLSRYTQSRLLPGDSAPAGCRTRTAAKIRDKDLLTRRRLRAAPNSNAQHRGFSLPKTPRPRSAAADRGLVRAPCGELPERALRK